MLDGTVGIIKASVITQWYSKCGNGGLMERGDTIELCVYCTTFTAPFLLFKKK